MQTRNELLYGLPHGLELAVDLSRRVLFLRPQGNPNGTLLCRRLPESVDIESLFNIGCQPGQNRVTIWFQESEIGLVLMPCLCDYQAIEEQGGVTAITLVTIERNEERFPF